MAADYRRFLVAALFSCALVGTLSCTEASSRGNWDDDLGRCVANIESSLKAIASSAPEFSSIDEAAAWIKLRKPIGLRTQLENAGAELFKRLRELEEAQVISEPFANIQLASELLWSQYFALQGVSGCRLHNAGGVEGEILEDQLYLIFVRELPLEKYLRDHGLEDLAERRRALFFALVLTEARIEWNIDQLVRVLKYHPGAR